MKWLKSRNCIDWLIKPKPTIWLFLPRFIRWADKRINRIKKNIFGTLNEKEKVLSACSVLMSVSKGIWPDRHEKEKFVQEWIRKRSDVVVMNQAIMAGTIVCPIGVYFLKFLPSWSIQYKSYHYLIFATIGVGFLLLILLHVTNFNRTQTDIVIAGVFKLRSGTNWGSTDGNTTGEKSGGEKTDDTGAAGPGMTQ